VISKRWISSVSRAMLCSGRDISDPSQNAKGSVAPTKASASANSVRRSSMMLGEELVERRDHRKPDIGRARGLDRMNAAT